MSKAHRPSKKATSKKKAAAEREQSQPGLVMDDRDGEEQPDADSHEVITSLEEGKILDYITNSAVKDSPKEQVRQRIARALFHEYGISVDDMATDFKLKIEGRTKKIDIAIFRPGEEHTIQNLHRIVVCEKEPKKGTKGAYKMRNHEQASDEFALLHSAMSQPAAEACRWGLWTNGIDFFFFEREETRFDLKFHPRGDWPMADGSLGSRSVASQARLRRADREMLLTAFRRCHNYIHGNEGMPKDAAFWQFLYLIFAKLHDERRAPGTPPRFWAGLVEKVVKGKKRLVDEQFDPAGQRAIRDRVASLVEEVAEKYKSTIFRDNPPRITLSDRALAFIVAELAKYDLGRTELDAKGAAYQELVKHNIRGDRGQYFTPRGPVDLMVAVLDPKPEESVLDPACGTGGFLVSTLRHIDRLLHAEAEVAAGEEGTDDFLSIQKKLIAYAETKLHGADFDPFLVRAAQMNVLMASNGQAPVFNMNTLEFPAGHLEGAAEAVRLGLGSRATRADRIAEMFDVVMTNPPFGADIPITDPNILQHFELAHVWERSGEGFRNTGVPQASVSPDILFIERCIAWAKPNGRVGLVVPAGVLGNPGTEFIRWWILHRCWVLAAIDMPADLFVVEADVDVVTSLLFLKKKPRTAIQAEDLGNRAQYPVFMAVAEAFGLSRRGETLYKRAPDGQEIVRRIEERERIRVNGKSVLRTLRRGEKVVDDDLPEIGVRYRVFRGNNEEPGGTTT